MGNASRYQNQINIRDLPMDSSLCELCPLFYQQYSAVETTLSPSDRSEVSGALSLLTGPSFYEYFCRHHGSPDQDYSQFIPSHLSPPLLVYLTLLLTHETLSFLVFYQTKLEVQFSPRENKELQRQRTLIASKRIVLSVNQQNTDSLQSQNLQEMENGEAHLEQQNKENAFNLQAQRIRNYYINSFLPVFSKYNYNAIHRKDHFNPAQKNVILIKYRQVLLCLAQVFQMLNLFLIQHMLKQEYKVWRQWRGQVVEQEHALSHCVVGLLQGQLDEMVTQGQLLDMTVRYLIIAKQEEDLDQSFDFGVDNQPVSSIQQVASSAFKGHIQLQGAYYASEQSAMAGFSRLWKGEDQLKAHLYQYNEHERALWFQQCQNKERHSRVYADRIQEVLYLQNDTPHRPALILLKYHNNQDSLSVLLMEALDPRLMPTIYAMLHHIQQKMSLYSQEQFYRQCLSPPSSPKMGSPPCPLTPLKSEVSQYYSASPTKRMVTPSFSSIPRNNVTLHNISFSLNSTFSDKMTREEVKAVLRESIQVLQKGMVFTKYGTGDYFKGSKRLVFLSQDVRVLCWSKNLQGHSAVPRGERLVESQSIQESLQEKQSHQKVLLNSHIQMHHTTFPDSQVYFDRQPQEEIVYDLPSDMSTLKKQFELKKILRITNGRVTPNFRRFKCKDPLRMQNSFSLVLRSRSIDLEAPSLAEKETFLRAVLFLVQNIDFGGMARREEGLFLGQKVVKPVRL